MRRSSRRLLIMVAALPVTLVVLALLYALGMEHLEGEHRTFWQAFEWAGETITTTGYGADSSWRHPVMQVFVVLVQFAGVVMAFLVFPIFLIPFFEERFESRLPNRVPRGKGQILIYRWGPAVATLVEELEREHIPVVILEDNLVTARRLHDRGRTVVFGDLDEDEEVLGDLVGLRGIVANGADHANAVLTLVARQRGFTGPIVALVEQPSRRAPMMRAGATAVFTPRHALAAALAAKASIAISPRVTGEHRLGNSLEIAEVRVHRGSALVGKTLAEADLRGKTGATIIGKWNNGVLDGTPSPTERLDAGSILVAAGSRDAVARLGELTTPVARRGHFIVLGYDEIGRKVAQFLTDAGEEVRVIHTVAAEGVHLVGDRMDPDLLRQAGVAEAQAVLVVMESDSETTFAAAVVRGLVTDAAIIASVDNADHVARVHRAGADFVLSIGQVAGQLLSFQLLGEEAVSLQPEIKLVKAAAGELAGQRLLAARIRERTGCLVIAIERGDEIIVEFEPGFEVAADDAVYLSGTPATISTYFDTFPGARAD
ncbi:MAG: NAD-binding protein [Kofleriaceae bacterium]